MANIWRFYLYYIFNVTKAINPIKKKNYILQTFLEKSPEPTSQEMKYYSRYHQCRLSRYPVQPRTALAHSPREPDTEPLTYYTLCYKLKYRVHNDFNVLVWQKRPVRVVVQKITFWKGLLFVARKVVIELFVRLSVHSVRVQRREKRFS